MNNPITNGLPVEPVTLEDLEKALTSLRGVPPANWLLVAPDGRTWSGENPLVLAAQATYRQPGFIQEPLDPLWADSKPGALDSGIEETITVGVERRKNGGQG